MDWPEQDGEPEGQGQQRQTRNRYMYREDEGHGLADIVVDPPPKPNRLHDRPEIVLEQDHGGGLARHISAALTHGHADMGGLERRRVVDTVASHGDDFAIGFERLDDAELLLGHDTGEDGDGFQAFG